MFINLTNHPSDNWQKAQRMAAEKYGNIIDIPFPQVDPYGDEDYINSLTTKYYDLIIKKEPRAVLVAGEFSFCYQLVDALLKANILVLSACSVRNTQETMRSDGSVFKQASFDFVAFRKYQNSTIKDN